MLQQTQVAKVMPYFERFVARFPNVGALAAADLDEVLHLWSGLGYYARARNLHRAARMITEQLDGAFPDTESSLRRLPGVGRSTAAAIVAQAYGIRAPILDGNAKRVLARQHRVGGPVSSTATQKELWRLAEAHTPAERSADYTQAIMDLGATVCVRARPRCDACPVNTSCKSFAANDEERFPERPKRRNRRLERRRFFVLIDPDGACLVDKRPPLGIWGGLYSPPERPVSETVDYVSRQRRDRPCPRPRTSTPHRPSAMGSVTTTSRWNRSTYASPATRSLRARAAAPGSSRADTASDCRPLRLNCSRQPQSRS